MISKMWLINAALLTAVVFFSMESYSVWSGGFNIPEAGKDKREDRADYSGRLSPDRIRNRADYEQVATSNLFSPERKEFIPEESEPEPPEKEVPEVKPLKELNDKIYLQGVVILDGFKTALVNNPYRKTPQDPKNLTVKEGDSIGDIKVVSILPDKLNLEKGGERYEIKLYDEKKPPRTVVKSTGDTAAAPQVIMSSSEIAVSPPGAQPGQPAGGPPPDAKAEPQGQSDQEFEYINTPFGKIKRAKKK
ncbi:MAG: hypothetical protein V1793_14480 [Pseudomonadota bacterium]